ncbi:MAG TPA: PspA/IM30 family protein [Kofleriaceae bacterium]|nr:PspA/IM30 family protein [Kofleriaceae bacterium]
MGLFSRMKDGIKAKANAAIDKAIDPEKEVEMAILELEEQRKKALQELVSYKASAKQMEDDIKRHEEKAAAWEKRAMAALRAGDEDAAREALRQKKASEVEAVKIKRDRDEAAGYAIQLNKSRKEFETKLQILKLKKGTLATQLAAARSAGGDAFGNDPSVWDKFRSAEERIEEDAIATEVDAALRGEQAAEAELERAILGAGTKAGVASADGTDDALAAIKAKVAAQREAKQKAIAEAQAKALPGGKPDAAGPGKGDGA